ncbi:MAG: hypothetical protein RID09_10100 [Coleofasciculus sp. G1-WW12-02]|uniref:hypothetical protein n=1 Tax=Coleofasciculus sp. G1-WW12-02 TaxID=3068483 RepID=UPI0033010E79
MNKELSDRIIDFFNFWRKDYNFIDALDSSINYYQANVLIWAALDTLSNHWAKGIGQIQDKEQQKKQPKSLIFDAFLERYAGAGKASHQNQTISPFQMVSLPHIWHRAECCYKGDNKNKKCDLPKDVYKFLKEIERRDPDFRETGQTYQYSDGSGLDYKERRQTRQISDDLRLDEIVELTLEKYPEAEKSKLEKWLAFSRFGAIAYKEMRCPYIHEGQHGTNAHSFPLGNHEKQPTYSSCFYTTPPIIEFGVKFMLGILESCINNFEAESLKLGIDPAPK